jgi:hypothetical protein
VDKPKDGKLIITEFRTAADHVFDTLHLNYINVTVIDNKLSRVTATLRAKDFSYVAEWLKSDGPSRFNAAFPGLFKGSELTHYFPFTKVGSNFKDEWCELYFDWTNYEKPKVKIHSPVEAVYLITEIAAAFSESKMGNVEIIRTYRVRSQRSFGPRRIPEPEWIRVEVERMRKEGRIPKAFKSLREAKLLAVERRLR